MLNGELKARQAKLEREVKVRAIGVRSRSHAAGTGSPQPPANHAGQPHAHPWQRRLQRNPHRTNTRSSVTHNCVTQERSEAERRRREKERLLAERQAARQRAREEEARERRLAIIAAELAVS